MNHSNKSNAENLIIYSAKVCPFSQRILISLNFKKIKFQIVEIDLDNKPADFFKLSPSGKVPLLKHGDKIIYDSSIVNEYLDETFLTPHLLSTDAYEKAMQRIWIAYCNNEFIPLFYKVLLNQNPENTEQLKEKLIQSLLFIENEGLSKFAQNQPYFGGNTISLVDITFYPFFERFIINEYYRHIKIPDNCVHLRGWIEKMRSLPEVKSTENPPEFYIARYAKYADGTTPRIGAKNIMNDLQSPKI